MNEPKFKGAYEALDEEIKQIVFPEGVTQANDIFFAMTHDCSFPMENMTDAMYLDLLNSLVDTIFYASTYENKDYIINELTGNYPKVIRNKETAVHLLEWVNSLLNNPVYHIDRSLMANNKVTYATNIKEENNRVGWLYSFECVFLGVHIFFLVLFFITSIRIREPYNAVGYLLFVVLSSLILILMRKRYWVVFKLRRLFYIIPVCLTIFIYGFFPQLHNLGRMLSVASSEPVWYVLELTTVFLRGFLIEENTDILIIYFLLFLFVFLPYVLTTRDYYRSRRNMFYPEISPQYKSSSIKKTKEDVAANSVFSSTTVPVSSNINDTGEVVGMGSSVKIDQDNHTNEQIRKELNSKAYVVTAVSSNETHKEEKNRVVQLTENEQVAEIKTNIEFDDNGNNHNVPMTGNDMHKKTMRFCWNCGNELPEGSKYCNNCGIKL